MIRGVILSVLVCAAFVGGMVLVSIGNLLFGSVVLAAASVGILRGDATR